MRRRDDRVTRSLIWIVATLVLINTICIVGLQWQETSFEAVIDQRTQQFNQAQLRGDGLQRRLCRFEYLLSEPHPPGVVCPTPSPGGTP